ncbi:MAG: SH3 domain-containing protein, partial [Chloroflexota bacterium]
MSQRVDRAAWPTPQMVAAAPTATPFPKISLADVATPTPVSAEPTAVVINASPDGQLTRAEGPLWADNGLATNDQTPIIPETATPPTPSELPPVTHGIITISAVNLRQGPGVDYPKLGTLQLGQTVDVLATNPRQDWVLVQSGQLTGWISLNYLDLFDSDKVLPVVRTSPPEQVKANGKLAPLEAQPGSKDEASGGSAPVAQDQGQSDAALSPVTTAKISGDKTEIRPGPGAAFAPIDELTDPQQPISVLAVDSSRKWALVQPASAHTGWVALEDLTIDGSVADAPQIFTAWVVSNGIEVRSGPGIFHDQTGQLAIRSLVRVLGLDDSGSWALIQPIPGGSLGWSPIQFLKNVGQPWTNVPHAPDLTAPVQAVTTAEPFTPTRPISESKIVFQRSSGGDIMVINPDGTGLRRLTSGIDPVLSPDGRTVAFTRWQGESGSLWLIGIDGSNERQVLGFIKQAKGPDWSPDGSQIVLNFQHGGRLESTRHCTDLTQDSPASPPRNATDVGGGVDKNGEPKLCWTLPPDPHWGLRIINLADGSFEDVDGGTYAFRPAWDPAQSWRIVSDGGRGLLAVDLNRDDRHNLTDEINDGSPVFSPDGRYLVVTSGVEGRGAGYNLYRLNADGSGRVQLTQTPLWVPVQPDEATAWNNVAPAWSPDAAQIIFLTDRTGQWEIWVMNVDGSNQRPMFSDEMNA